MRRILWIILTVLLAGIVLYTLAGFTVAPQLVKRWIEAVVTADSGRRLEAEAVAFNPYTFEVSFTNLTLYDRENKTAFSIRQFDAVLDPRSLSRRQPTFSGSVSTSGLGKSERTSTDCAQPSRPSSMPSSMVERSRCIFVVGGRCMREACMGCFSLRVF